MGLKFIYTIFVGLLVATFVGVGIAAFYVAPKHPDFPKELETRPIASDGTIPAETPEQKQASEEFDRQSEQFQKDNNVYTRNVFIIAIIAAVIILTISLTVARHIEVIADGLLLGGTLTLFYGIIRGFETDDNRFRFLAVTIGLITTLVVGYLKFIKPEDTQHANKK